MTELKIRTKNYSEYLSFRSFYTNHPTEQCELHHVASVEEATCYIKGRLARMENTAILLSGGMDSAILLPFMPKGTVAYTIYHPDIEDNEVEIAKKYCDKYSIVHKAIPIQPEDYMDCMDALMISKGMPLSPAEPIFYLAAKEAVKDGFDQVVTGAGADTCLGGFDKLRRRLDVNRYQKRLAKSYLPPKKVLNSYTELDYIFLEYLSPLTRADKVSSKIISLLSNNKGRKGVVDSKRFLREVGVERFAFDNAINLAGAGHISPLKEIYYDFDEAKNQKQPKYFIESIYENIYGEKPPKKLGLQKPSFLLSNYTPSNFDLFQEGLDVNKLPYNKKFLIYCLERFELLRKEGRVEVKI